MNKRYDTLETVNSILTESVSRVQKIPYDNTDETGHQFIIEHNVIGLYEHPDVLSNVLVWSEVQQAFLSSIYEVLPEGEPSLLNQSQLVATWTKDISRALQFADRTSIDILVYHHIGDEAVRLYRRSTSTSSEAFPAQSLLDRAAGTIRQQPLTQEEYDNLMSTKYF